MNLIISAPSCRAGRSCAEFRNLAVAAERHHCECVHASIRHFHSRRTARHTGHGDSANVAWLVLEESRDMPHRHMTLDRIAADNRRVARRQSARHIIRSEEHTSELQSLMRISYAAFCLQKTTTNNIIKHH